MSLPGIVDFPDLPRSELEIAEAVANELAQRLSYIDSQIYKVADGHANALKRRLRTLGSAIREAESVDIGPGQSDIIDTPVSIGNGDMGAVPDRLASGLIPSDAATGIKPPVKPGLGNRVEPAPPGWCIQPNLELLERGNDHVYITVDTIHPGIKCHHAFYCVTYSPGVIDSLFEHPTLGHEVQIITAGPVVNIRSQFEQFYYSCLFENHPLRPAGPLFEHSPFGEDCTDANPIPPKGDDTYPPDGDDTPPAGDDTATPVDGSCDDIEYSEAKLVSCVDFEIEPPFWGVLSCTSETGGQVCCYQGCKPPEIKQGQIIGGPFDTCEQATEWGKARRAEICGKSSCKPKPDPNKVCSPSGMPEPECEDGWEATWDDKLCEWTCKPKSSNECGGDGKSPCDEGQAMKWNEDTKSWDCLPYCGDNLPFEPEPSCLTCPTCIADLEESQ